MARPKQDGLLYFSFDTDFFYADKRIKRVKARLGNNGLLFYIYLLTEIYRNGYCTRWDEESVDNAMDDLGLTEGFIEQAMICLTARELITKIEIVDSRQVKTAVITSPGIQKRYQEAVKNRKRQIEVDPEIWLLGEEETASCIKVTHNVSFSEKNQSNSEKNQSNSEKNQANKIKEKEKKKNEMKENNTASQLYYPDELLNQAFLDFLEMRKKIKKPMTDRAVELAMRKLKELSTSPFSDSMDNDTAIKILEQSTMNCWQGLFPLKEDKQKQSSSDWERRWRDA